MHNKKHPAWMPFSMNFSQQNSNQKAEAYSYTPTFSWSSGTANPTVQNIQANFSKFGKICFLYARYNITDVGSPDDKAYLRLSLPKDIVPIIASTCLVSPYQIKDQYSSLGTRVSENGITIVSGIGGNYSGKLITTGYQGFAAFFITK